MGSVSYEPKYGQRLMPVSIDEVAASEPYRAFASLPRNDKNLSLGYEDITFAVLANAINRLSWYIEDRFGRSETFETFLFLGAPDLRYHMILMAAAKTGHKVLFSSHRNTLAAHVNLIDITNCKFLLSTKGVAVADILEARPMEHELIPELDDLLQSSRVKAYPFKKTFQEAVNDPFLVLHTSGSTGLPKPVVVTHAYSSTIDQARNLNDFDITTGMQRRFELTHPEGGRFLIPFMPCHGIGAIVVPIQCTWGRAVYVPGFRHSIVSVQDIIPVLRHANVQLGFLSPAILEEVARAQEGLELLEQFQYMFYGGAALEPNAGRRISEHTNLQNQWGITETGRIVEYLTEPEDWQYMAFDANITGMQAILVDEENENYELVFNKTSISEQFVSFFANNPKESVFKPGDLWSKHLTKPNLWKFVGRGDDMISFADGGNFQPVEYELKHAEANSIRATVIAGFGHLQACLIVDLYEPLPTEEKARSDIMDEIWESVQHVNASAPQNGVITRDHIVIATPEKPFCRVATKGTVARKATIKLYNEEIEQVYSDFGDKRPVIFARVEGETK